MDLLQLLPSQSRPPVFLLVDNLYAVNTGTGRWTAKSNLDAVATLKSSLLTLRALTTVAVHRPTSRLIIHKCCVNLCGSLWIFVDICGYRWGYMWTTGRYAWIFVDLCGSLWI